MGSAWGWRTDGRTGWCANVRAESKHGTDYRRFVRGVFGQGHGAERQEKGLDGEQGERAAVLRRGFSFFRLRGEDVRVHVVTLALFIFESRRSGEWCRCGWWGHASSGWGSGEERAGRVVVVGLYVQERVEENRVSTTGSGTCVPCPCGWKGSFLCFVESRIVVHRAIQKPERNDATTPLIQRHNRENAHGCKQCHAPAESPQTSHPALPH